jgi:hypothetical protein
VQSGNKEREYPEYACCFQIKQCVPPYILNISQQMTLVNVGMDIRQDKRIRNLNAA